MHFFEDLGATVEIPSEATLSKVVFSDDHLRVVVFAFDTGQELTEHTARSPVVVQTLRGRLEFTVGSTTAAMTPGSWIHLPADEPHSVRALEPSVMVLSLLKG